MSESLLGCGEYLVALQCRGGSEIAFVPFTALSYGRRIDDMSDCTLRIGHYTNDHSYVAPYGLTEDCCGVLAEVKPWQHEVSIRRNEVEVWVGPIVKKDVTDDTMTIYARDLFQWFERRLLPRDRDFFGEDLATIFTTLASDALHRDPSPNITFAASPTDIPGDRTILSDAYRRAADEMRELLRSGLDMTMVGRTMLLGGTEVPTAELGKLVNAFFDGIVVTYDGLQTETESTVIGASTDTVLGPVAATAGGPVVNDVRTVDPVLGLVQGVVTESGIEDEGSCAVAAQSRHDFLGQSPTLITARVLPSCPVSFDALIPGARADLRIATLCDEVTGDHRLQSVNVNVDAGGEKVGVVFTNLGTTGEALADALPYVRARGAYTLWYFPESTYNNMRFSITPESEPAGGWFWSNQFGFAGGHPSNTGGYIGLQTQGFAIDGHPKVAIFSISGGLDCVGPEFAVADDTQFDGYPGARSMITYPWIVGRRYTTSVRLSGGAPIGKDTVDGPWYDGLVKDEVTGIETLISSIQVPVPVGVGRLNYIVLSFTEFYAGFVHTCDAIPYAAATFSHPRMNNNADPDESDNDAPVSYDAYLSTGTWDCGNSAVTDLGGGAVRHEIGT